MNGEDEAYERGKAEGYNDGYDKGKEAGSSLISLGFFAHRGSNIIAKVLKSAMANAEQKKGLIH